MEDNNLTPETRHFIKKNFDAGKSADDVRNALTGAGWNIDDASRAIEFFKRTHEKADSSSSQGNFIRQNPILVILGSCALVVAIGFLIFAFLFR